MKDLISLYREAVRDDWDKQTDATLANMQEAEQNLLSRLSAGEEAVKKVAELEKLNDKYRQDTQDNYGDLRGTIKFRKKPIVNEAIRWTGDNLREIIDFTGLHPSAQKWTWEEYEEVVRTKGLKIFTLEGPLFASVGDYIMRGVNGEFYPIKPDISPASGQGETK